MTTTRTGRRGFLRRAAGWALAGELAGREAAARGADTLRFGQSAPMSGPAQHWGIEYQRGIRLAFDEANAGGGVAGRRLELVAYDDLYEPTAALDNTAQLLAVDKVFGLIGFVGAESAGRCLPVAAQAGVPFIAPLTGAAALRKDPPAWLFNLRPGDDAETLVIAKALATIEFRRVAVLRQADADGAAALQALLRSLHAAGLAAPVAVVEVERNSTGLVELAEPDIRAAAARLLAAGPQAVVCLSAYATTGAIVRRLRELRYAGGCYATSLSGAAAIGPMLGRLAGGLSITQVVPSPFDASRPLVAAYRQRLQAAGDVRPEYVSLEGWLAGRVVARALDRAGAAPTRERFMAALESLGGTDLGGVALRWDPLHRQALSQVALTVLDAQGHPVA
jgi:branched-chain amino acid transport system substrate-binding protein